MTTVLHTEAFSIPATGVLLPRPFPKFYIDIDGTILGTIEAFFADRCPFLDIQIVKQNDLDASIGPDMNATLMEFINRNHDRIQAYPGAINALSAMSRVGIVTIVTNRTPRQITLFRDRYPWFHVIPKSTFAERSPVDLYIDDDPCPVIAARARFTVLVDHPWNQHLNFPRAASLAGAWAHWESRVN